MENKSPNIRLRNERKRRGWSQQELADTIGTTHVNVSRWESGATRTSPYFRQKLCEAFDKTPAELGLSSERISSIWNIPHSRNPFFIGRERLLALLHQRLSTTKLAALTQAQALFGLGGIGKTQTAAEYAYRYVDDYTDVLWVRAASRETLVADFVALAEHLDLPQKHEQDQPRVVAAVKRWLAAKERWLLILDNADDLPLAQEFLPANHQGYILFTTRAQAAGTIAASIEVNKLSLEEGVLLLLRWTKLLEQGAPLEQAQATDAAAAELIVKAMNGLPLAIVQAAAYVDETGCSLTHYLNLYHTQRKELLAHHSSLLLDNPHTVATTWSLSFQQIEQAHPIAADLLRLCAFLAADAIPEELLARGASQMGAAFETVANNPIQLDDTILVLRKYSLLRRERTTRLLSIHPLVQAVLKDDMSEETQRAWAERTIRVVNAAFPAAQDSQNIGSNHQRYLPHVQECATLIQQYHLRFPEAARLLYEAGMYLYIHGFYAQSQLLHQQALTIRQQVLEPDDPTTAESLNILAMLSRIQGSVAQAEQLHKQALAIREITFGSEHPITAESLNNLAVIYRIQGMYEQAEPLLRRALSIHEHSPGSSQLESLMTLINLAKLYSEQQKYEQAEPLLQQVLATSERSLKPEHPLMAQSLDLLARRYLEQGKYEQAEALWKQTLVIREKTLEPEHPTIAANLDALAELNYAQGRYLQARTFWQRALDICEKSLGAEYPDTIAVRQHLTGVKRKIEEGEAG